VASLDRVNIVVCNAGIGGESSNSSDYSDEGWHQIVGVNLNGAFFTQRGQLGIGNCACLSARARRVRSIPD
jgi:NAD(P)-dependent dehydrogenase (short-subunit alcohol dehydrogenase family)